MFISKTLPGTSAVTISHMQSLLLQIPNHKGLNQ